MFLSTDCDYRPIILMFLAGVASDGGVLRTFYHFSLHKQSTSARGQRYFHFLHYVYSIYLPTYLPNYTHQFAKKKKEKGNKMENESWYRLRQTIRSIKSHFFPFLSILENHSLLLFPILLMGASNHFSFLAKFMRALHCAAGEISITVEILMLWLYKLVRTRTSGRSQPSWAFLSTNPTGELLRVLSDIFCRFFHLYGIKFWFCGSCTHE